MTITPDDGFEQQRAALGRVYRLLGRWEDSTDPVMFPLARELRDALAGPDLTTRNHAPDPDQDPVVPRWAVHRQTRTPWLPYNLDHYDLVTRWMDQETGADQDPDLRIWQEAGTPPAGAAPTLSVRTFHGPVDLEDGDLLLMDVRGGFYPCDPAVFALSFWEEH